MLKAGLDVPRAGIARTLDEALALGESIGYPLIVRASFTLGGGGSGFAANRQELAVARGPRLEISPGVARSSSRSRSPAGRSSSSR